MGDNEHFPVLVFAGVLVQIFKQFFGLGDPLGFPQTIRRTVLQADFSGNTQRAEGYPAALNTSG